MLVSGPSSEHVDNIVEDFSYFGNMSTIFFKKFLDLQSSFGLD